MNTMRSMILSIPLTAALCGAAIADTAAPAASSSPGQHWRHGAHRGMMPLLRQLNLTASQQAQVTSIIAQSKERFRTLRASRETTRTQLAVTPPNDAAYQGLLATAKTNAANALQLKSDIWGQVYAILTPSQQAQIPDLVAARQQQRAERRARWQASHADT